VNVEKRWRIVLPIYGTAELDISATSREQAEEALRGLNPITFLRRPPQVQKLGFDIRRATVHPIGRKNADPD
jgi:hypothetical protein